ncbi:MAM and LDL-receptor class A domain-containing protein 1-like [Lytechinus pictus]|uniref:MAM and LDL-receptor class A domain-containing protein 1-like n=1 Tax=Lytechinus pictus TaxID=7653 RepID=UPI0030B9E0F5
MQIKAEAVLGYYSYGDIALDDFSPESDTCDYMPLAANPINQDTVTCDFDSNWCGWRNMPDDNLDWYRQNFRTPTTDTGPDYDHTQNSQLGFFLYFEASPGSQGYNAKLQSVPITTTPNGACFKFWLHMYGQSMGELEVSSVGIDGNQQESLWKQSGTLQNKWVYRQINIVADYHYQIIFNAVRGVSYWGDIAIDDIFLDLTSSCPVLKECSFETDFCGWSQEKIQDDFDWSRSRGKDHTDIPVDNTVGVDTGYYAWVDTTTNPVDGQSAILFSPTYTLTSIPHCVRFYFYHDGVGALTIHSRESGRYSDPLWEAPPIGYKGWRFGSSSVTDKHSFEAAFKGTVGSTPGSLMAIDDVRIDVGGCPSPGYCTFEEPICDWFNVNEIDKIDWVLISGRTSSGGTGPTNDHTTGNVLGHYLYIEASNSQDKYNAILQSVDFSPRIEGCFSFYYHMYGLEIGTLNVHLQELQTGAESKTIWTKTGEQGNAWFLAEIDVSVGVYHLIQLEGIDSVGYRGDIALDDIKYTEHNCKYVPPPTPTPTKAVTSAPLQWDCSFEGGTLCSWTQGKNDDFDWSIQTGSTPTVGTGPPADHTTQTKQGFYIVIDASSTNSNDAARIYSNALQAGTPMCMTFWFHMYGAHVGQLNVGYGNTDGNTEGSVVWTKSGDQGYNWMVGHVALFTDINNPKIYLEGTAGDGYQGDIAVDDIKFNYGDCPALLFCDFQADDACGYANDDTDELDWVRDRGMSSPKSLPQNDHTSGTQDGFYMRIMTDQLSEVDNSGTLLSSIYPNPLSGFRCTEFWYMISDDFGELTVEAYQIDALGAILPTGVSTSFKEPTSGLWRKASIEVPSSNDNVFTFKLVIKKALPGVYAALDDIYVKDQRCTGQLGSCDFEIDTCDWTNTQNADEIDWLRHSGSTGNQDTGPQFDHTTGSLSGWYMYIDSALGSHGTRARLESSSIDPQEDFVCFSLWYHMKCPSSNNKLTVAWETAYQTNIIWSFTGEADGWNLRLLTFSVGKQYRMMIEGVHGDAAACDIAIDDLYLFNGACSADTTPPPPFTCLTGDEKVDASKVCDMRMDCTDGSDETNCGTCFFDDDQCGYTSNLTGLLPWIRQGAGVPATPPPNLPLPPLAPNSTFMVVDRTADQVAGADYPRLVSPWIQETGSSCFVRFWYYLDGADDIIVTYKTSPAEETVMYRAAIPMSGNWEQAIFTVQRIRRPFQMNFLGMLDYASDRGVIAVSSVEMIMCGFPEPKTSCDEGQFRCSNRACISMNLVCDYSDDCGDYSDELQCDPDTYSGRCNFESGMCSYTNIPADYNWVRTSGALDMGVKYAPTRDHTLNEVGGYYMLADAKGTGTGDVARIASPIFRPTGQTSTCMISMFIFQHGPDIGTLNVYTRTSVGGPLTLLISLTNFDVDSFARYNRIISVQDTFQVIIEAVTGKGPDGVIAIDDISFSNCDLSNDALPPGTTLAPPTTPIPCPIPSDYQCGDGQCIPQDQVCDFIVQCSNGRDEQNCGACEFDDYGYCGSLVLSWIPMKAGNDPDTLPTDHNNNLTAPGFYLHGHFGLNSLTTAPIGPTGALCHVQFYYYMTSNQPFTIFIKNGPQIYGTNGKESLGTWVLGTAFIGMFQEKVQITFEHLNLDNPDNPDFTALTVGLDGISFFSCLGDSNVSPDISCTFEDGMCGYIQGKSPDEDDFDWLRGTGETSSDTTGPRFDHTTGSGYYMYIEADGQADGDKAILKSHLQRPTGDDGVCLTWYYHMYGPDVDKFNVYIQQDGTMIPIFKRQGTQGNQWMYEQWTVISQTSWAVVFEAFKGLDDAGDIAIDDIIVIDGTCSPQRTCDFEVGFCSWSQDSKDDFDWSIGNNGSSIEGTGPPVDHTMGTDLGMFAYVKTTKPPRANGEVAQIFSPVYPAAVSECLTFWFHLYGVAIGKLEVLVYDTVSKQSSSVWTEFSHSEMGWHYGRASLTANHPYQIVIKATLGDGDNGDIAVDDLTVLDEACSRPGFCDFENGRCGWSNEKEKDQKDWLRNNGATSSPFTGPSFDHTTGTDQGMYMYFEADSDQANVKADLVSEFLPKTQGSCMTFWYHMFGDDKVLRLDSVHHTTPDIRKRFA